MKIKIVFSTDSKVSLLKNIPEHSKYRLLGYNGIGKTLTANILASISGEIVWEKQEKIKTLAKVLHKVNITITIKDDVYCINSDIEKWRIDEIKGNLKPKSIGTITLNGTEISAEKFRNDFRCHIIRGKEDINSQIVKMANKVERIILFDINNLKDKFESYQQKIESINELLNQNGLCAQIQEDLNDMKDYDEKRYDSSVIGALGEISIHIKNISNTEWISLDEPKESYDNLIPLKDSLRLRITEYEDRIKEIKKVLSPKQEDRINRVLEDIEKTEAQLRAISFPLDKEKYSTKELAQQGKFDTKKQIDEINKIESTFMDFEFRNEVWKYILDYLKGRITDTNRDFNLTLLLGVNDRAELKVKELKEWCNDSGKLDKEKLRKLAKFKNWKEEKERLEEIELFYDEHIKKLEEEKLLKKELERLKNRYQTLAKTESEIKGLAKLDGEYKKLESLFNKLSLIQPHLESLNKYTSWTEILGLKSTPNNPEELIKIILDFTENTRELIDKKKRFEERKKEYFEKIKKEVKKINIPQSIKSLIDEEDVILLCKLYESISNLGYLGSLRGLGRDCKNAFNIIRGNKDAGIEEDLNKFLCEINKYLGNKLILLLKNKHFKEHVFNNYEVISIDPQNDILTYIDKEGIEYKKFISDYSTGQKAFAFSLASILQIKQSTSKYSLLVLDEFGAMLDEDKENYLLEYLNKLQKEENWPTKYIIVLPYKNEFERAEYKDKENIEQLKKSLKEGGYAFEKL